MILMELVDFIQKLLFSIVLMNLIDFIQKTIIF